MIERIPLMLLQMIPFLMAIVFHEVAHAFVARKYGDDTAERLGRLTLNPVPHIDPIGTLLVPMLNMLLGINFLIGWAKPVPINFNRLKPYRSGLFLTALAGPAANVCMAFVSGLILVMISKYVPNTFYLFEPLTGMASISIQINFALAFFNLIPLPPLDGSKMVESFLSYEGARQYEKLGAYSFWILIVLLWTGALTILSTPIFYSSNFVIGIWRAVFGI